MSKYVVLDIEDNDYYECDTKEEVDIAVTKIQDYLHQEYDGTIEFKNHINIYKKIETISFTEDIEETKEMNEPIGKWEHKKIGGNE